MAAAGPRCGGRRAGVPGQEAVQVRAGEGFPAVAAAFVEVGGKPGQEVQAGHLVLTEEVAQRGEIPGRIPGQLLVAQLKVGIARQGAGHAAAVADRLQPGGDRGHSQAAVGNGGLVELVAL